ncbi:MAG: hypothetical protein L0154_19230 [Chloroflexi bacterium]|nr:hypothetical protein [Chloroflexota bacterium]
MRNSLVFIIIILSLLGLPAHAQERPPAILTFEATEDVIVTVNEAEQRSLTATLRWEVINFSEDYELALHAYAVNDWLALHEDIPLRAEEIRSVPLIHPLNFGPITYRLRVLNASGTVVDERFTHIDFTVGDEQPAIAIFEVIDTSPYDEFRINAELAWQVDNRLPHTNIEFDQILPNGQIQPIELPRLSLWVASAGNGRVRPYYVVDNDTIQVRIQVVDVRDDTVYDSREITIPAAPPPVPPTRSDGSTPTPTPTDSDGQPDGGASSDGSPPDGGSRDGRVPNQDGSRFGMFTISPQPIDRSQPVTISWDIDDATQVTLQAMHYIIKTSQPYWTPAAQVAGAIIAGLEAEGQIQYTIPLFFRQGSIRFRLETVDSVGNIDTFDSGIISFQTFPMFFTSSLISTFPPETSEASYQEFENGLMIWRGDTNTVFVLGESEMHGFWNSFTGSTVVIEENPPEALFKPEGPFSGVWHNNANVQGLGWATGPSQSYPMQWQWSPHPVYSMFDATFISIPNGVIRFVYLAGVVESGPAWSLIQ